MTIQTEFNFPKDSFGYVPGAVPAKMVYSLTEPQSPVEGLWWVKAASTESSVEDIYFYTGAAWLYFGLGAGTVVSETQPQNPRQGMRWLNMSLPAIFVYYVDNDSGQWVEEAHEGVDGGLRSDLGVSPEAIGKLTRGMKSVSWFDFGVVIGADSTVAFGNAVQYAADNNVKLRCEGGKIILSGSKEFVADGKDLIIEFSSGGGIQLANGAWTSAPLVVYNLRRFIMTGLDFNGNRANATGNNAGFAVLFNPNTVLCNDLRFTDLRRVGLNILSSSGNRVIKRVELSNIYADNTGVSGTALGEVIKVENADNVTIDGFTSLNTSGTGDGQVQKCFYCGVVTLKNFIVQDASPSLVYPAISNVRNDSLSYENIYIGGASQVSIEDNSCLSYSYKNIRTATRKAAIWSSDGAEKAQRQCENMVIDNWIDSSSEDTAFNFVGVKGLSIHNLQTNKDINITRDTTGGVDYRSSDLDIKRVSCRNINTLLCTGSLSIENSVVSGVWSDSSFDAREVFKDSTFGTYDNLGTATRVTTILTQTTGVAFSATIPANGTLTLRAPSVVDNLPFSGVLVADAVFGGNFNQYSRLKFDFFSFDSTLVKNKTIVMSGTTARSGIDLTSASAATKQLTFTSTENVNLLFFGKVDYFKREGVI